jgi:hypothetical protein
VFPRRNFSDPPTTELLLKLLVVQPPLRKERRERKGRKGRQLLRRMTGRHC